MSHLICSDHKRRVMVLNGNTYHRSDGSKCPTKTVVARKNVIPVSDLGKVTFHNGMLQIEEES